MPPTPIPCLPNVAKPVLAAQVRPCDVCLAKRGRAKHRHAKPRLDNHLPCRTVLPWNDAMIPTLPRETSRCQTKISRCATAYRAVICLTLPRRCKIKPRLPRQRLALLGHPGLNFAATTATRCQNHSAPLQAWPTEPSTFDRSEHRR